MAIRLLVVDDHRLFREGLSALLRTEPRIEVVGQAASGREGVERACELRPDVILMDIGLQGLNGIEAARQLRADCPHARIVFVTAYADAPYVVRAVEAGAAGYVLKDSPFEEVVQAIVVAAQGETYLSPRVAAMLMEVCRNPEYGKGPRELGALSPRQREVLQLVAEGSTTKQIASQLHVSSKTIETHRQMVMDKLGLHSVAALTKFAIRAGVTMLEA
jgi:DNA-binding NarL/FixJ family response regulator